MTELIPQRTAILYPGDTLGKEEEPWGLYQLLGLEEEASREEIRERTRELCGQYHPDTENGDVAAFKTITQIRDFFLEEDRLDSKEQYDSWSRAEEIFEDPEHDFETITDQITRKQRMERRESRVQDNLEKIDRARDTEYREEYGDIKGKIENADSLGRIKDLQVEKNLLLAEAFGADIDEEEVREEIDEFYERRTERTNEVIRQLGRKYGRTKYQDSLWDITSTGDISFVSDEEDAEVKLAEAEEDEGTLHVTAVGGSSFYLPEHVYCKVKGGDVRVEDASLEGVIQVLDGDVELEFDPGVLDSLPAVEIRASEVRAGPGYEHFEGDLYIPEGYDVEEPEIEVQVANGEVDISKRMFHDITWDEKLGDGRKNDTNEYDSNDLKEEKLMDSYKDDSDDYIY